VRIPESVSGDRISGMRLGIAHHFGWAVAVTASADHRVVDRRRIELIEPGVPTAPIHHEGGPHTLHRSAEPLDDDALTALVADVRTSVVRATSARLDELASASPEPVVSMSLRAWPADFPEDIAVQRRVPYESRADSVMYCRVLAELARERGWVVHFYNSKDVEDQAAPFWVSERMRCCTARGQRWVHRGRRTIGWRSRQRSWSPDHAGGMGGGAGLFVATATSRPPRPPAPVTGPRGRCGGRTPRSCARRST